MKASVVLFDADGVLTLPEETFATIYARSHGLDPAAFEQFFRNDWPAIATGKKDLKEFIAENPGLWQWHGSVDDLLAYWFKTEDVRNDALLQLIDELRGRGISCYLATDQEKYRGQYIQDVMFKDRLDGYFISAELGVTKAHPAFFEFILNKLQRKHPGLEPRNIVFFDDRQPKVDTARSIGIDGQLFKSVEQVAAYLT